MTDRLQTQNPHAISLISENFSHVSAPFVTEVDPVPLRHQFHVFPLPKHWLHVAGPDKHQLHQERGQQWLSVETNYC